MRVTTTIGVGLATAGAVVSAGGLAVNRLVPVDGANIGAGVAVGAGLVVAPAGVLVWLLGLVLEKR